MRIATEGALWGAVKAHGFLNEAVIVSDDAGQFDVGQHALCWVHAERLVHKLETFTDQQRAAQEYVRGLIWWFYADLKAYRADPTRAPAPRVARALRSHFPAHHGFATLDRLLQRLHANKAELLMVLDHPEIPLHTNGSENDIRCQVTKRQVSGGTKTDTGRELGCEADQWLGKRHPLPGDQNDLRVFAARSRRGSSVGRTRSCLAARMENALRAVRIEADYDSSASAT